MTSERPPETLTGTTEGARWLFATEATELMDLSMSGIIWGTILWIGCWVGFTWAAKHWLGEPDASMRRVIALMAIVVSTVIGFMF